jgi:hypothetical protein
MVLRPNKVFGPLFHELNEGAFVKPCDDVG